MDQILKFYRDQTRRIQPKAKQVTKQFMHRKNALYLVALVLSGFMLLLTTVYAAYNTSNYFSTNSDAIIATHQYSNGIQGNTIALPGSHSNILMAPILYLQGHLPYDYKSFTAVNIMIVLATVLAWALLLIKLFGRKYEIPVLLLLASLLFASTTFSIGIGNTTFRNIGYPIALWFIFIINDALKKRRYSRRELLTAITGSVLFCILLAGDSFFIYSILVPLLIIIFWYWIQSGQSIKNLHRPIGIIAGVIVGATLIKWVLASMEIIYFDYTFLGKPKVLPYEHLGPSLKVTFRQLTELQGGSIFGMDLRLGSLLAFINLGVLIVGTLGLILIIINESKNYRKKKKITNDNNFVFISLAVAYFVILAEYILSGYAVVNFNGQVVDLLNTRYLTLLPLITIVGFIWLLQRYYKEPRYLILLSIIIIISIIASYPTVKAMYAFQDQTKPVPSKASVYGFIGYLTANDVDTVVTDFWYGPPIRFWSGNRISYAPQINCNQPLSFDSREDWYRPVEGKKTALIIDRAGLNYGYWACSDEDLINIYGEPVSRVVAPGVKPGDVVHVWIYDYDVRERLQPFPTAK